MCEGFAQTTQHLFEFNKDLEARWSSPENLNGLKGNGGKENFGAKGHPYDTIGAGKSKDLLNIKASGDVTEKVAAYQSANAPLIPVTTDADKFYHQYDSVQVLD